MDNNKILSGITIAGFVLAMIVQFSFIVYRAAQLEQRVIEAEMENVNQSKRLDFLDQNGSRKLEFVEDRQNDLIRRIERLEEKH